MGKFFKVDHRLVASSGTATAKAAAHWVTTGLPLTTLAAIPLESLLNLPAHRR